MKLECAECGKKDSFGDVKDIQFVKWRIIAWNVATVQPIIRCPECEDKKSKKKEK